jgi:hypothetical protein
MKIHRGVLAVVLAGALVTAACSSDDDSADTETAATSTPSDTDPAATSTPSDTETAAPSTPSDTGAEQSARLDPVEFRRDMRVLWTDHVAWTRLFIVSAVADLPDTDATAARLLQNQADIGDAVAEFYGDDAGAQLEALLRDHILTAGQLIAAAKAGDTTQVEDRSAAWYANGDEIARFLAGANPAWPVATLQDMMRGHLDQTLAEATAQLTGDFEASVAEYGHITTHILQMADTLADGIITQFPDQFPAA